MSRPNYQLEESPVYTGEIPQLLNDDPVLAESGAFHDLIVRSLNNTKASYQKAEKAQKTADDRASIVLSHEEAVPAKGDNTYTFQVTEMSDVVGEIDGEKLEHARKIGELEGSLNGWRIFTQWSQIGITPGTETMESIAQNLPDNAMLQIEKLAANEGSNDEYPFHYGFVIVQKRTSYNCSYQFYFYDSSKELHIYDGFYRSDRTPAFSGWIKRGSSNTTGTWTPELVDQDGDSVCTYITQTGIWCKTGKMIHLEVRLDIKDWTKFSGTLTIPIPVEIAHSGAGCPQAIVRAMRVNAPKNTWNCLAYITSSNQAVIGLVFTGASDGGNVWTPVGYSHFAEGRMPQFYFSIDYIGA